MSIILTLLNAPFYIDPPRSILAWGGWLVITAVVLWEIWRARRWARVLRGRDWLVFIILAVGTVFSALFFGIRIGTGNETPIPLLPAEPSEPVLMLFSALPWILAAGFLGHNPAVALAIVSGLITSLYETHSLYTVPEMALLALLFGTAINQRYRGSIYRLLRHPLITASLLTILYPLIFIIESLLVTPGPIISRLDYSLTRTGVVALTMGGELLIAGFFAEIACFLLPKAWGWQDMPFEPAPYETSLHEKFQFVIGSLILALVITLVVGEWILAGNAAQTMFEDRMENTAQMAAQSVPFFLETGQSLIRQQAADPRLLDIPPDDTSALLAQNLRSIPFFRQLYLLDASGIPVSGFPEGDIHMLYLSPEEQSAIQFALKGVDVQTYSISPRMGEKAAQVSFIASIKDSQGQPRGVLIGRSDLASNPFMLPIIDALNRMKTLDGEGLLLDEKRQILYSADPAELMTPYSGILSEGVPFREEVASNGTRQFVYYQPAIGHAWSVVLMVPVQRVQQMAMEIAAPLLLVILAFAGIALLFLRLVLRMMVKSLQSLSHEAGLISQGQLDHPLPVMGEDEIGRLSIAFEQMRLSLKIHLDELNRLLQVSQSVASTLDFQEAVKPILEAALSTGASSARVVLDSHAVPESVQNAPLRFGAGTASGRFAYLDDQILELSARQDRLLIYDVSRAHNLIIPQEVPRPGALLAVALRHENLYYGCLWVGFNQPRIFTEQDERFLYTMAGQAALAAANTRLYMNAEIGRQRLEAMLSSTPEPVIVIDAQGRLLLANPAAFQILDIPLTGLGLPIEELITLEGLLDLFHIGKNEQVSREIDLPDRRIYYASISPVIAEGQPVGKICILRDITYFKELDTIKSEFVSNVSHDLRSPLTLIRGYASMVPMVGDMNEQQKGYVQKVVTGVDNMFRLVNNLLDLGRMEAGVSLRPGRVTLDEFIGRVIDELQMQVAQKNIKLTVDLPGGPKTEIEIDQELMQQALFNLLDNAIKYTPVGGKINVRAALQPQGLVQIEVQDSGIGIAPLDQPRLFEKFYRAAQNDPQKQRGSGLGLAIVKSVAERHGGKAWVESQLGRGSTFYISIPVRQTKLVEEK